MDNQEVYYQLRVYRKAIENLQYAIEAEGFYTLADSLRRPIAIAKAEAEATGWEATLRDAVLEYQEQLRKQERVR